ncbi:MAG: hypothetical protein HRU12_03480 [Phaeodactylibacter sp.]|nr:hypothetical protein [Phaeodactylibacter sp.]
MYKFREGYPAPKGLAAERAAQELERIRQKRGTLTSAVIVEESRSETAILHNAFEWNDTIAAQKYRERQAGTLVRSIVLIEKKAPDVQSPVYTLTMTEQKRQYMPSEIVINDEEMFTYSMKRLSGILSSAEKSANDLMRMKSTLSAKQRGAVARATKYIEKASRAVANV